MGYRTYADDAAVQRESGVTSCTNRRIEERRQKAFSPVAVRKRLSNQRSRVSFLPALMLLAGCSGVPSAELAWQITHAVDVAQTVQIARSSCFREDDALTRAMIGEDPSVGEAVGWGVAMAGVHFGVTRWLESIEAPRWLQGTWQALTITNTAYFVKNNQEQGIDVWGTNCHGPN